MRTRTWCVAAALACSPTLVAAQTVLSEADALANLSEGSPRVREIRSGVDVTRAEVLAAGRWPNPRFTFNRESVAGVTENMFMVAQPLPITGRRGLEVDAASALVAASEQRADEAVRQVRAALRRAYADLVGAQLRATEMTASRDRLRGLAEVLGRREAAGESAGYDRLRAEREVIEIEADLTAARADRARAQAALAAFFAPTTNPATLVAAVPQAGIPGSRSPQSRNWWLTRRVSFRSSRHSSTNRSPPHSQSARQGGVRFPSQKWSPARSHRMSRGAMWERSSASTSQFRSSTVRSPNRPWHTRGARRPTRASLPFKRCCTQRSPRYARLCSNAGRPPKLSGVDSNQRGTARTHRSGQLRRWRAQHSRAGRRLSEQWFNETAAGRPGRGGASRRNRARTCERMGDPMMKRTLTLAVIVSILLAAACRRGATGAGQGASPEEHTLDVTSWTQQTELYMEHPPLVAGQTIRFAVHLTKLADFQALNAGRPIHRNVAGIGWFGRHPAGLRTASARRISCRGQAPTRGTVSLGVARQRARSLRSARSGLHDGVR